MAIYWQSLDSEKGSMMGKSYLRVPLDRLRQDALHGVSAAREAYRQRDPVHADIDLGPVVDPAEQAAYRQRVIAEICGRGSSNVG